MKDGEVGLSSMDFIQQFVLLETWFGFVVHELQIKTIKSLYIH